MSDQPGEITLLLKRYGAGDRSVENDLFRLLYLELHSLARHYLWAERKDHILQPTALINEAFLRLVRQCDKPWVNRSHFVAVCAQVMRRVLVDIARKQRTAKRAGERVSLNDSDVLAPTVDAERLLDLDEALSQLAILDERQARVVELRYFAGLSEEETAELLCISPRQVRREWAFAKAWLQSALTCARASAPSPMISSES